MVSSITKLVLIGAGLAIAAGLAYFTYQYTTSETLGGQLARSRLGLDKPPPIDSLLNKEADPSKPLSQQPKDKLHQLVDDIFANFTRARERYERESGNLTGGEGVPDYLKPWGNITSSLPSSSSKAAYYYYNNKD